MRQPNPRRVINHLNKAMERKPQDVLHRVRIQPSSIKRDPPKGPSRPNGPLPRHNNVHNGGNTNRHHQNHNLNHNHHHHLPNRMNGRMFAPGQFALTPNMTPQQQMAFYQMYQQQQQMIGSFANGPLPPPPPAAFPGPMGGVPLVGRAIVPPPTAAPTGDAYANNLSQPQRATGNSLFDRIHAPADPTAESGMDMIEDKKEEWTGAVESEKLEEVPCKFGMGCTKPDCPFGHPTPAAAGKATQYISGEKCPFGAGCKNRKCTGSHPSPASAPGYPGGWSASKIDQDCKFFPNCSNPACPFKQSVAALIPSCFLSVFFSFFRLTDNLLQPCNAHVPQRCQLHSPRLPLYACRNGLQVQALPQCKLHIQA